MRVRAFVFKARKTSVSAALTDGVGLGEGGGGADRLGTNERSEIILAILSMSHRKNVLLLLLCAALTAGQKPPAKGVVEVVDSHPTPVIDRTTAKAADIQGGFETGNAVLVQGQ